jgi:hypothetical protein
VTNEKQLGQLHLEQEISVHERGDSNALRDHQITRPGSSKPLTTITAFILSLRLRDVNIAGGEGRTACNTMELFGVQECNQASLTHFFWLIGLLHGCVDERQRKRLHAQTRKESFGAILTIFTPCLLVRALGEVVSDHERQQKRGISALVLQDSVV